MASTTRRQFLAATAGVAVGAGFVGRPVAAQSDEGNLAEWFADTDGVNEVVDKRGQSRVEIVVGASGNGGDFAFAPAAVHVDPDTTVVWRWTGNGGTHNVVAKDSSFESEYNDAEGKTFTYTPDSAGIIRYVCAPHETMGMKGALVVGNTEASLNETANSTSMAETTPTEISTAEASPAETFGGWLDSTDNYEGVVDRRGESEVTVKVGVEGNGGDFAFEPAALRVDPGTTVVWEWVGDKEYDVVDPQLGYQSDQVTGPGHRFAVKFGGDGLSTYECRAYGKQGMRGVVLVGEGPISTLSPTGFAVVGGVGALVAFPMLYGLREHIRDTTQHSQ